MTAKAYLMRLRDMDAQINRLLRAKEQAMASATNATSRLTATRVSGTSSRSQVEDAVVRAMDLEVDIVRLIDRLADAKAEAGRLIGVMSDERHRAVLVGRYLEGGSWSALCGKLGCVPSTAHVWHGEALATFERIARYYGILLIAA